MSSRSRMERLGALAARAVLALSVGAGLQACHRGDGHHVGVQEGATTTRFPIRGAFAEYIELPGDRNELRITLASYAVSCERWIAPREDDAALTIVVSSPDGTPPAPGVVPWSGLPDGAVHGTVAVPKLLRAGTSRLFQPGGSVKLTQVQLEPRGVIAGTLAFEHPGDPDHPPTHVDGAFEAKLCRLSLATR